MLSVDTGKYRQLSSSLLQVKTSQQELFHIWKQISLQTNIRPVYSLCQNLNTLCSQLADSLQITAGYFQQNAISYESSEKQIQLRATIGQTIPIATTSGVTSANTKEVKDPTKEKVKTSTIQTTHRKHTTLGGGRSLMDYAKNGVCAGVYGGLSLYKLKGEKNLKYVQGKASLTVGGASGSLDGKVSLLKNRKLSPSIELEASASAMVAEAKAMINVGNPYVSATAEVTGTVGAVSGNAKAVINKDEITLKAEVGAAALKGEAKGTISILGLKITATGTGELGAVGASAGFSKKKGEFEFGGKASFIGGLGFHIKVTY